MSYINAIRRAPPPTVRKAHARLNYPVPLYKARSGFLILTEECLTFRTVSPSFLSSRQIGSLEPHDYQVIIKRKSADPYLAGRLRKSITSQLRGQTCRLGGSYIFAVTLTRPQSEPPDRPKSPRETELPRTPIQGQKWILDSH